MSLTPLKQANHRTPARDRLLNAANELFYAEGVNTVGVDRIIEQAGVSRASFYNNFDSKDQLIHTYLMTRHEAAVSLLHEAAAEHDDPRQRILAVFDAQASLFRQADFNGCPFVGASAEAPSGGTIQSDATAFRASVRTLLTDLAHQAGAADPVQLGRQLHLLYDGAALTARMDRDPGIATASRRLVEVLLDATVGTRRS